MQHSPRAAPHIPLGLLLAAGAALLVPIIACTAWVWTQWATLETAAPGWAATLRVLVFAVPILLGTAAGAVALLTAYNRWGRYTIIQANKTIELTRARVQIAPNATSFTYHDSHQSPVVAPEPLALPEPEPQTDVGPVPAERWMAWADAQPHILFGGKTKAGKTTTTTAILARRLQARETVFIIDPHSSGWMGLPIAGRVSCAGELERALLAVLNEYLRRMGIRDAHKQVTGDELPHDHFGRMTVLVDEANAIAEAVPKIWEAFAKELVSGARKVGIALIVLAQSPLVEDLKISGGMRKNFAAIALDIETVQDMIDRIRVNRATSDRKQALQTALEGLEYPAAARMGDNLVWLLDRSDIDQVDVPDDAVKLVWAGWDFARGDVRHAVAPTQQLAPPDAQTVITLPPPRIPVEVGEVRVSAVIAHMIQRSVAEDEIAKVVASLILRAAPDLDRNEVQTEVAQRAQRFVANGAVGQLAAQLDRAALLRSCLACGGDVALALAIYGGKRQAFYDLARAIKSGGNTGNTPP